jgi:hypothetical protein
MGNKTDVKVTGVYEDLPYNSAFHCSSWHLFSRGFVLLPMMATPTEHWISGMKTPFQVFAQLKEGMVSVSFCQNQRYTHETSQSASYKPAFSASHEPVAFLYTDFKDGKNAGGIVYFVWLFGIISVFVLLLACINFMNLSTARSEKRAKEVGIRKSVGSVRGQLVFQFLSESFVITSLHLCWRCFCPSIFIP